MILAEAEESSGQKEMNKTKEPAAEAASGGQSCLFLLYWGGGNLMYVDVFCMFGFRGLYQFDGFVFHGVVGKMSKQILILLGFWCYDPKTIQSEGCCSVRAQSWEMGRSTLLTGGHPAVSLFKGGEASPKSDLRIPKRS